MRLRAGPPEVAILAMMPPAATPRLERLAQHIVISRPKTRGTSRPTAPAPASARAAPAAAAQAPVEIGILTEATGDHLGGFLGGFATAIGVGAVSIADITEGAQFATVRGALPPERMGGEYTVVEAMLLERRPALTLVTAEPHSTA